MLLLLMPSQLRPRSKYHPPVGFRVGSSSSPATTAMPWRFQVMSVPLRKFQTLGVNQPFDTRVKPGGFTETWSHGERQGWLKTTWRRPSKTLHSEWWYYRGSYTWIFTTLACRAGWCSPFGGFCSCSASIQGWFLTSTWCLIAWTNPSSTGQNTSRSHPLFFDTVLMKLIWTFLFLIGLSGDGTFISHSLLLFFLLELLSEYVCCCFW